MISGRTLFQRKTPIQEQISQFNINTLLKNYSLSKELSDLLKRLLEVDDEKRINFNDLFEHQFFKIEDKEENEPNNEEDEQNNDDIQQQYTTNLNQNSKPEIDDIEDSIKYVKSETSEINKSVNDEQVSKDDLQFKDDDDFIVIEKEKIPIIINGKFNYNYGLMKIIEIKEKGKFHFEFKHFGKINLSVKVAGIKRLKIADPTVKEYFIAESLTLKCQTVFSFDVDVKYNNGIIITFDVQTTSKDFFKTLENLIFRNNEINFSIAYIKI
jgi:serine/threonine protein kinase